MHYQQEENSFFLGPKQTKSWIIDKTESCNVIGALTLKSRMSIPTNISITVINTLQ